MSDYNSSNEPGPWAVAILSLLLLPPMLFAALWLMGTAIETVAQRSEEHDRCLRNATNGLEIRDCR